MNASQLHDALSIAGAKLLAETLPKLEAGEIIPQPQDGSKASYAGLIRKQDGKIDFSMSPEEIERLIRGFDPWPGAYCDYEGTLLKLWAAKPLKETSHTAYGTIISATKEGVKICCNGGILLVTEIQIPGKKRVKVQEYLKGNTLKAGTLLK